MPTRSSVSSLHLIAIDDVEVLASVYVEALAEYIASEEWRTTSKWAFVVVRYDENNAYVIGRKRFLVLAKKALTLAKSIQQTGSLSELRDLANMFNVHEHTPSSVIRPGVRASDPAIAYDADPAGILDVSKLQGAWVLESELPQKLGAPPPSAPKANGPRTRSGDRGPGALPDIPREMRSAPRRRMLEESDFGGGPSMPAPPLPTPRSRGGVMPDMPTVAAVAPAPAREETLCRTPHMDLSPEQPLSVGQSFDVSVYTDEEAARPGEKVQDVIITAPSDVREFHVTVYLCATAHFLIKGSSIKSLLIKRDESKSQPVTFSLQVAPDSPTADAGTVVAAFEYNSRPCGKVTREVIVQPASASAGSPPPAPKSATTATSHGDTDGPVIQLAAEAKPADMTITILNPSKDLKSFDVIVKTPLLPAYKDGVNKPWTLPNASSSIVHGHFEEFVKDDNTDEMRFDALKGAGEHLFEATPDHFRDAFWQIIDQGLPLRSILIVSEEPFVPWELMIPFRVKADGNDDRRPALGVTYSIGRWVSGQNLSPNQLFTLAECRVVAPEYTGGGVQKLEKAEDEAAFVLSKYKGKRISPAIYASFKASMKAGGAPLLHFICHGAESTPVSQRMHFENGEVVTSTQFRGSDELREACSKHKPLVFLNACEVGRPQPALVSIGGFAQTFINRGAQAVIAPLWSVKDDLAHEIAKEFYNTLEKDPEKPFAEIVRDIRAKAYDSTTGAEDTYAAYCFYGDPLAHRVAV